MDNSTLNLILASNRPTLFNSLLEKESVDYKEVLYYLLRNTSVKVAKNRSIVKRVYTRLKFNKTNKRKLLLNASKFDFIELVKLLLSFFKRGDEMKDDSKIKTLLTDSFLIASQNGGIDVVRLLLTDKNLDPTTPSQRGGSKDNEAIRLALIYNHAAVVKLLLADSRVDPSVSENFAIRWASKNGHIEVVKTLLTDPRVDPNTRDNQAIREASYNGHTEIVKMLLADKRVDPSSNGNNYAIRVASQNGRIDIVKLLLADLSKRVDPSAINNDAIRKASKRGRLEVVKILLKDSRVDPSAKNNYAIQKASASGHTEIIKLLSVHSKLAYSKRLNTGILAIIAKAWLGQ